MFFSDAGDLGLSVLLTAWDDWRVGVMRKIRLPLRGITFQNMSLVHPGNVFEINLEFEWEVYTNTEGRQFAFQMEILLAREVLSEDRRQLGALQGLIEICGCVEEAGGGSSSSSSSSSSSEYLAFFECVNTIPL